MPLTRFKLSAIEDGGIATADLADGAVTTDKLADSAVTIAKTDSLLENPTMTGTEAAKMPVGTTAQRANATSGDIRFNSTLNLMEYYDGTIWKSIDSPPTISSADVSDFDAAGDTITLTGSNFQSGATVKLVGDDGTDYNASSVTVTNATTASFDITSAMATDNDPFDVVLTNPSGLSGTLANALDFAPSPAFSTASGSIGTIYDSLRSSYSLSAVTATSTDADDTLSYALGSGDSLPAGLSLNSSTGAITGTATAVGSDTTTTFDIVATATSTEDSGTTTNTREFSITVKAPVVTSYTSTGSGTFSVPSGISAVDVLVVAGGGSGGAQHGSGGGAGGLIYRPAFPVTPGGSISYTVGAGGDTGWPKTTPQMMGDDSTFGTLTAKGGGHGSIGDDGNPGPSINGQPGGSGAGGGYAVPSANGAPGTQPQQPGDSGTYGFGNPGGQANGPQGGSRAGGGGGGAGAAGAQAQNGNGPSSGGDGGNGKQYGISGSQVYYAAGGGGGGHGGPLGQGGQGGGGQGGEYPGGPNSTAGVANRGGGGGGAGQGISQGEPEVKGGGSGIIIVSY